MWKKLAIGTLASLAVVIGLALYIFREDLYEHSINPRAPFEVMTPAAAPDYSQRAYWAAWPDNSTLTPAQRRADVFYIHTTTFITRKAWNGSMQGAERERVENILIPGQAALFEPIGALYAPHYRQATLYTFFTRNLDSTRARMLAYTDVARAFEYFLKNRNQDRPFFIVGHGQGAIHGVRLLADYVAGKPLQDQMVAAYLTGATVPLVLFKDHLKGVPPCESPAQTGCVAAWTTFYDNSSPDEFFKHALYWSGEESMPAQTLRILCVNPLTWTIDEKVAAHTLNEGARPIIKGKKGPLGPVMPNLSGAQCRSGILYTDRPKMTFIRPSLLRGDRTNHLIDFNLFFTNVRENAALRLDAYLRNHDGTASAGQI